MVANGDKGSFGKIVEDVGVVDAQLDFEFFEQQAAHELRSRGVAAFSVHGVDLVDGQESQQEVCYARVAVEGGYECPEVVVVQYVGAYFVLGVVVCLFHLAYFEMNRAYLSIKRAKGPIFISAYSKSKNPAKAQHMPARTSIM